ncbi:MAG: NADH-quinone oxidoreductase subunit NuoG [Actinobacteria bacterium]|nr:NADH-quinone oxidoreductase subunit NuoG [Actinomycetota bacterium]MCL6094575.1 NADH-quinone oxidoreductase subunit NuoG [Actinomycetota bacterium]
MSDNPVAPSASSVELVSLVIDGIEVQAKRGELVIEAAERVGIYLPRFCYHPRMKPVGMCRACLAEISGPRGFSLQPTCFTPVAEGMEVRTKSEKAIKAQEGVLEFLLINHPLDCPVCDKGGECPLQDQDIAYGPGESRFVEEKRHWAKPIAISDLVYLDRERCIQCGRCTRFAAEVAGDPFIDFFGRGDHTEVGIAEDRLFDSYFSGNTVQICPVGALTAKPYRFRARPWDLEQAESTCMACSVGCRVAVQSSGNRLVRVAGIDSDPVNHSWLCDKGRFSFEAVNSENRLVEPLIRREGVEEVLSWSAALRTVADKINEVRSSTGPDAIALLGGARGTNEDAYAWAKLAKSIIGTDAVDAQLADGLDADLLLSLPRATIDETTAAKVLVTICPDIKEELPVLYLRLREAVVVDKVPLVELSPYRTSLSSLARVRVGYYPGFSLLAAKAISLPEKSREELTESVLADGGIDVNSIEAARALVAQNAPDGDGEGVIVAVGRPSLAEDEALVRSAVMELATAWPKARFLPVVRRGNLFGALDMGLAPGLLPGRVGLDGAREWFEGSWGKLPEKKGPDARGILERAAKGELELLILLGCDPLTDFPDRRLAEQALTNTPFVVAVDCFGTESARMANLQLPAAMFSEKEGTTTNLEGRVTRVVEKIVPPRSAWPDWMIAAELAGYLGRDLGFSSTLDVTEEIVSLAPAYRGLASDLSSFLKSGDGVVVPIPTTSPDGPFIHPVEPIDPMATPGISQIEQQGSPPRVGSSFAGGYRPQGGIQRGSARVIPKPMTGLEMDRSALRVPPRDGYSFRLISSRKLYSSAVMVRESPSLQSFVPKTVLLVNRHDLEGLGLESGSSVRVRSPKGTLTLPAVVDDSLAKGVVFICFGTDTQGASSLIDVSLPVNDVRLEVP